MKAQIKKWLTFNDTEVGMLFIADCIGYIGGAYDVAVDVVLIAGTRITPVLTRSERGLKQAAIGACGRFHAIRQRLEATQSGDSGIDSIHHSHAR